MPAPYKVPGVYVNEFNAPPNSVVPVETAVPAFIGYTPGASCNGEACTGTPIRIESWQEFLRYFARLDPVTSQPLPAAQQSTPIFHLTPAGLAAAPDLTIAGRPYDVRPDASTLYYLWNSVRLFYCNGGGPCYIVSVGPYGPLRENAGHPKSTPLVNPNVRLADLVNALTALESVIDATLIAIPDAVLLGAADYASLAQQVLAHCGDLQSRIALFDLPGGAAPDPQTWFEDTITPFRNAVGLQSLSYGVAYYPFLCTSVVDPRELDYRNIGGGAATLATLLPGAGSDPLKSLLAQIGSTVPGAPTPAQIDQALRNASSDYAQLQDVMLAQTNLLPPSGALAGVYTRIDNSDGVWRAPANVPLVAVSGTTLAITDQMQAPLNGDAATGKSINAIRVFPGHGTIVWGARTLDGKHPEYCRVSVHRTQIMIEQSMRRALNGYVFEPNDANTWSDVTSALNDFLTNLWKRGALAGASPDVAFSVACGLGTTMTTDDIVSGRMNVSVKVAFTFPAEFIVINLQQTMHSSRHRPPDGAEG